MELQDGWNAQFIRGSIRGELYFVTSLIFASNRWGNDTGIDYIKEARNIIDNSMQKVGMTRVAPLINLEHRLITFTPDNWGGRFTDPSYHVPAFYEVWAEWLGDGRSEFWRDCAIKSREFIHHFWNSRHEPYSDGYFDAYYDGFLRLFAFMHLSGYYRIIAPQNSKQ